MSEITALMESYQQMVTTIQTIPMQGFYVLLSLAGFNLARALFVVRS
jgi:hypothetical protein